MIKARVKHHIQEPILHFGHGKCNVKSFETRGLLEESTGGMLYAGQGRKERELLYAFQDGELNSCVLMFNMHEIDIAADVARFYAERYTLIGMIQNTYLFESKDKMMSIAVSVNERMGLHAIYYLNLGRLEIN